MDRVHRPTARRAAAVVHLLAWVALATQAAAQVQQPRFESRVDITSVDVTVVDSEGRPIHGLTPADFTVRIGGAARRVVTADWVPLTDPPDRAATLAPIPDTFSTNLNAAPGRIILLTIDQQNIRFGGAIPIRDALIAFVDRLQPSDRVGLMILGRGGRSIPFTADRQAVKSALAVEWLYVLRAGGAAVSTRAGDLDLARTYARQYRDRNGPESPLVQLWLDYMSSTP